MEELISVIIPVYKVEKYIRRCLDSVINQTYKNLEIILINDESPDNCGKICNEYAQKDDRIKVLHIENGGVSNARNIGIEVCNGEYITFIDSDDFIDKYMIEKLYIWIKKNDADISICGTFDMNENMKVIRKSKKAKLIMNKEEYLREILYENYSSSVCWGKLYRRRLFLKMRFNKCIKIGEDLELLYRIIVISNKIVLDTTECLYNWTNRKDSVTKTKYNEDWKNAIVLINLIKKISEENYPQIIDAAIARYVRINMTCIGLIIKEKKENEDLCELIENIKPYVIKNIFNKKISIRKKIKLLIIVINPNILRIIYDFETMMLRKETRKYEKNWNSYNK